MLIILLTNIRTSMLISFSLKMAKLLWNFGHFECKEVKFDIIKLNIYYAKYMYLKISNT